VDENRVGIRNKLLKLGEQNYDFVYATPFTARDRAPSFLPHQNLGGRRVQIEWGHCPAHTVPVPGLTIEAESREGGKEQLQLFNCDNRNCNQGEN
jgi:hypothetical protein